LWRKHREHCGVRRFWDGDDDEFGRLVHKPGGAEHARWMFDYDETAEDDDEAGYRFGNHAFPNGEYVSIPGEDGHMHTFQVGRATWPASRWRRSSRRREGVGRAGE